jgi:two-component system response regulator HydG
MPPAPDAVRVLVIDDDRNLADTIVESLERKGYACTLATSGKAGAAKIQTDEFDIVLTDLRMNDLDGLTIVKKVREHLPEAEVAVITGFNDVPTAQQAMKLGAAHYLMKPIDLGELRTLVEKSAERVRLSKANRDLRQQLDEKFGYEGLIGSGPKMRRVVQLLKAFAPAPAPVLIFGDNGTGKELAAKALHVNSPRRTKPFVAMNCAALNENLLDDEMFGHEPGAYTGGDKRRIGRFEHAHGGTLFLDEIGDMPTTLQAKLLRVLENGEVVRIGANDPIKVDVRVIAATNKNLDEMVEKGEFRRDLYQRLKVGVIRLPSMAERREDVPLLVDHFTKDLAAKYGKAITGLSDPVRRAFSLYAWPGNVRELRNLLESMILMDHDGLLGADDLPEEAGIAAHLPAGTGMAVPVGAAQGNDHLLGRPMEEIERYYIERALELTNNNREETARILGIGERTLYRKLQEWKKEKPGGE